MKITEFTANHYRNLQEIQIHPHEQMNLIYGQNAQGKTNLIEAIWLFSGSRSFRSNKDSRMIAFGQQRADLTMQFDDDKRVQKASITLSDKNRFTLNRVVLKNIGEFAGNFLAVVFTPSHLSIAQGSPQVRRNFLDHAIANIQPNYKQVLSQYERVVFQRNNLLKHFSRSQAWADTIDVWDLQMAKLGTVLSLYRRDYVDKLAKFAQRIYQDLSSQTEEFRITYRSTIFEELENQQYDEQKVERYHEKLVNNRQNDQNIGYTELGVHHDDLTIVIDGKPVKQYGSQGQQRSATLALKLAEAKLLQAVAGANPVVLLDDVLSELDRSRQEYLLNHIKGHQVFITSCEEPGNVELLRGKRFEICDGRIQE